MNLLRHIYRRRRELRPGPPDDRRRSLPSQRELLATALLVMAFTVLAGLLAISASNRPRFGVEQVLTEPAHARVDFRAIDDAATARKREDAQRREPGVYQIDPNRKRDLQELFNRLAGLTANPSYTTFDQIPEQTRKELAITAESWIELRKLVVNGQPSPAWQAAVDSFLDDFYDLAILTPESYKSERDPAQRAPKIFVQHPNPRPPQRPSELERYDDNLYTYGIPSDIDRLRLAVYKPVEKNFAFNAALSRTVLEGVMRDVKASYALNRDLSEARARAAAQAEPPVQISYKAGDVLVPAGRSLSTVDLQLIDRERQAYRDRLEERGFVAIAMPQVGRVGVIAVIVIALWCYILATSQKIARNPMRGLAITGLLLICLLLSVLATAWSPRHLFLTATAPTLLAAIVLAIAYDRRLALTVGAIQTLLVVATLGLNAEFAFVTLVGTGVAVGLLDEVRTRSKLIIVGMASSFAMAGALLASGVAGRSLLVEHQLNGIWHDVLLTLVSGVVTGAFVQSILPAIESLFRVTTAMTLKDLNDASHPLLRRLAQEAPGTYQHSLRIADMAEAAADTIGADALLCKVGAMYHDVGKINKPDYFVENQGGGPNRHEKLAPQMSVLIIVAHVKDGMEMARQYRLPAGIRQFIETHHGTTLVEYFYHAARQQHDATGRDLPMPDEFTYRYPGPRPQTREAAIMMICDGVEGAARTLPDPNPARFEQLVHHMIQKRLTDGQFDECGVTLLDLNKIEVSIVRTLSAMYHGRIRYPSDTAGSGSEQGGETTRTATGVAS